MDFIKKLVPGGHKAKKKKMLCCPHPTKISKLGRSVGIFFFFFF